MQGDFAEAEALLLAGQENPVAEPGPGDDDSPWIRRLLVDLCVRCDNPGEAEKHESLSAPTRSLGHARSAFAVFSD